MQPGQIGCVGHLQGQASEDMDLGFSTESSPTLLGSDGHQDTPLESPPQGLAVLGLGVLSPNSLGQCGQGCACVHLSRACAAMTLQKLISGGFRGNPAASMRRELVFPRQLRPWREVTRTRLGGMAFSAAELLRLSVGKRDASASSHQLPSDSRKAFSRLLWCSCRP